MESGFIKASSDNLPVMDVFMIAEFLKQDERFNAAEIRGAKVNSASRENYGNTAVGYVQLKREGSICHLKARICPEHRVRSKAYSVSLKVDEAEEKILELMCHDCAASEGGCKHSLAFLMWVHRRSEDPAPTEVACYWKKPLLANVGTSIQYVECKTFPSSKIIVPKLPDNSRFLEEVIKMAKKNCLDSQISRHNFITEQQKFSILSIHQQLIDFKQEGGTNSIEFEGYLRNKFTYELCSEAENETQGQHYSPLWHELRYGRITASKLYDASRCNTDGRLAEIIIGIHKIPDSAAMQRGRTLEKEVLLEVQKQIGQKLNPCGFILMPPLPILGASPDAITENFVVEVKCPTNFKTFKNYIENDNIKIKYKAQINLQMCAANKGKGLFCVADPNFEENKKVKMIWVNYDEKFLMEILKNALSFWRNFIFPKLFYSVSD